MNINLHINRLVVADIPMTVSDRRLLQASITSELNQMLTDNGLAATMIQESTIPRVSTNEIQLTSNNPQHIGQQVAQSLYGQIGHD